MQGTSDLCTRFSARPSTLKLRSSHTSATLTSPTYAVAAAKGAKGACAPGGTLQWAPRHLEGRNMEFNSAKGAYSASQTF